MSETTDKQTMNGKDYQDAMKVQMKFRYKTADSFFEQAKKQYIEYCPNWTEPEKLQSLLITFYNASKVFTISECKKLPHWFIVFTEDLPVSESTKEKMFDGFYIQIRTKRSHYDLLKEGIKNNSYCHHINCLIQKYLIEDEDVDYTVLDFFFNKFSEIQDNIEDIVFEALAKTTIRSEVPSDKIVEYLIGKEKYLLALPIVENDSLYFTARDRMEIMVVNDILNLELPTEQKKETLRSLISNTRFSAAILYAYYQLLTPEERENEHRFLLQKSEAAGQKTAYSLIQGKATRPSTLTSIPLIDYATLAPIIKERFQGSYLRYLTKALARAINYHYNMESAVNAVMEAYKDDPAFLSSEIADRASREFPSTRVIYLRTLYQTKIPAFDSSLHLYGE